MKEEFVIYTDGRKVKITSQEFIVGSTKYLMKGIDSVRMHFIHHYKNPAFSLMTLGISGIIMAIIHVFSNVQVDDTYIGNFLLTPDRLSGLIGLVLVMLGLLWLSVLHDKYAVVITTPDGDQNPITSTHKNYIYEIVIALKTALKFQKI